MNLFYFTASNKQAQINLEKTIKSLYPIEKHESLLKKSTIKELEDNNTFKNAYLWGSVPGENNITNWTEMDIDDRILTYKKGKFIYYSKIIAKIINPELAREVWGPKDNGDLFQYIYFLKHIKEINIDVQLFSGKFGYKSNWHPFGLGKVAKNRFDADVNSFSKLDNLIINLNNDQKLNRSELGNEDEKKSGAIACTDLDWFNKLSELNPNEINFWTPTPWNLKKIKPGDKFFFMLKSPIRKIGGYAIYDHYENLNAKEAWNKYGTKNGVNSFYELISRIDNYASKRSEKYKKTDNPEIGCIILKKPIFFEESEYFDPNKFGVSYSKNIVKFKYINKNDINKLMSINNAENSDPLKIKNDFDPEDQGEKKYGSSPSAKREGQNDFRNDLLEVYKNRCCITDVDEIEALEAAHIIPYVSKKSNHIQNGLLLRVDIHKLLDAGLISIDKEYKVKISRHLNSNYYDKYDGKKINLPDEKRHWPSPKAISILNDNFRD